MKKLIQRELMNYWE